MVQDTAVAWRFSASSTHELLRLLERGDGANLPEHWTATGKKVVDSRAVKPGTNEKSPSNSGELAMIRESTGRGGAARQHTGVRSWCFCCDTNEEQTGWMIVAPDPTRASGHHDALSAAVQLLHRDGVGSDHDNRARGAGRVKSLDARKQPQRRVAARALARGQSSKTVL
ncbi:hypothetical protein M885DRAFT_537028 [Pelagophyceae sp. CCMP2097]|nr:hypothetical protein M885DRAFT_537028 [Pelagophyceae sp. CCMP2097]